MAAYCVGVKLEATRLRVSTTVDVDKRCSVCAPYFVDGPTMRAPKPLATQQQWIGVDPIVSGASVYINANYGTLGHAVDWESMPSSMTSSLAVLKL
jgi:hypothetical protein